MKCLNVSIHIIQAWKLFWTQITTGNYTFRAFFYVELRYFSYWKYYYKYCTRTWFKFASKKLRTLKYQFYLSFIHCLLGRKPVYTLRPYTLMTSLDVYQLWTQTPMNNGDGYLVLQMIQYNDFKIKWIADCHFYVNA